MFEARAGELDQLQRTAFPRNLGGRETVADHCIRGGGAIAEGGILGRAKFDVERWQRLAPAGQRFVDMVRFDFEDDGLSWEFGDERSKLAHQLCSARLEGTTRSSIQLANV